MKLKIVIITLLLSSTQYAQLPENIHLEADNISYKKKDHLLQATSNVILNYQDLTTYTENFIYNTKKSEIKFPQQFTLTDSKQTITADFLQYNFKKNYGEAKNITIKSKKITIQSEKALIRPIKSTLYNTTITNCNLDKKHMYISSQKIDIYPILGVINAKQNWLNIHFLPFKIPIPYFPYGNKNKSLLNKNPYLPEIGENKIMGKYAIYKTSYIINKYLSGTTDIGYTENLYWIIGGSNTFYKNKFFSQALRYHYYNIIKTTSLYSITKINLITNSKNNKKNIIDKIITPFNYQTPLINSEINFILQKKGIKYDYWVDYLPKIELSIPSLKTNHIDNKLLLSASQTSETFNKNTTKSYHIHILNSIKKTYQLSNKVNLTPELHTNINQYNKTKKWNRLFFITNLKLKTFLNPEISYLQKLFNIGKSPFQHEQKFALVTNEISLKINHSNSKFKAQLESFYTLETQTFRKQNISLLYKFHCWGLGFNWRIKEKIITLQFTLN
tara:strand:+ start:2826 stop:4331 length:1506 start_codon:yes stop_codon:yes gene_type:complete